MDTQINNAKSVEVLCNVYEQVLIDCGAIACRFNQYLTSPSHSSKLDHALWMVEEIRKQLYVGMLDHANRWLGFVQSVLWTCGVLTLEEIIKQTSEAHSQPRITVLDRGQLANPWIEDE